MTTNAISAQRNEHRSIFVVDDNASIRHLIAELFRARGDIVETAADGTSAIAVAANRTSQFDIVVTDVRMPGVSGFELSNALAADVHDPDALSPGMVGPAVLFMSGSVERTHQVPLASDTVHGFIAKPFTAVELLRAVDDLLVERSRRMVDER